MDVVELELIDHASKMHHVSPIDRCIVLVRRIMDQVEITRYEIDATNIWIDRSGADKRTTGNDIVLEI